MIDDNIEKFFKEPENQIFRHVKPKDVDNNGNFENVIFETGLVFFVLEKNSFDKLIESFQFHEYSKHPEWIAEKYLEIKLQELNLYSKPTVDVHDMISESKNVFNISQNPNYELFIDTEEFLKLRLINVGRKNIQIVVNEKLIRIKDDLFFFNEKIQNIDILGCFIENKFEDWKCHLSQKKVNKITFS